MKVFNTTAVCIASEHYMVDLTERVKEIKKLVDAKKYFTINRARQYGKTTTLNALKLALEDEYIVVNFSFERLTKSNFASETSFVKAFCRLFKRNPKLYKILPDSIRAQIDDYITRREEKAEMDELFITLNSGIYGMLAAEIDQYQQIIADASGEKREQYYRDKMNEQSLNNAETAVKKEDIPTPEEQLQNYYQRMCSMPYNVLSNIDTPFRESERTPFYTNGTKELTLDDDTWYIFYCAHRDFWHEEMPRLTLIGIQFLLGDVLLALILSFIAYFRFKHRYEMDEYRRNLTASLAHDLKSPLMAISSYSENLLNDVQPEKKHHYSKSILENTQYMDNIIVNVLELSRLETHEKTKQKIIDLTALAKELLEGMQEQLDVRGLTVTVFGSCSVKADCEMMKQAIRNLLDNAVKYTPEDGSITVTGEKHTLSIVNDIAEEAVSDPQRLSEAFVKGDEARSNRMGTGLGLSIVRQIAGQNRMKLLIESSEYQFRVRLVQSAPISLKRGHKAK